MNSAIQYKALLFINGTPPKSFPSLEGYGLIACTDGAYHYLKQLGFPADKLDFISGDFDSHSGVDEKIYGEKFIFTPDQDKTDFEKALEILVEKGIKNLDVYGGSGGEMDHFLGNLTVAFSFKDKMEIRFYDEFSTYYFIPKNFVLENVSGRMISLYPFPKAENVVTKGLNWEIDNVTLEMHKGLWARNFAAKETVEINYSSGDLLFFVGENYL